MTRKIPASYPQLTDKDKKILHDVVDSGWYTEHKYCRKFARELCKVSRAKHALLVNSGSSANLIAMRTLLDHFPGKYVITCATSFPTTVAPIYQFGKVPIYVDIDPRTFSPNIGQIDYMMDKHKEVVAGAILTHTLGFPHDEALVRQILGTSKFLISDCCDALGATVRNAPIGTWSDIATYSFFPAHHIFSGEGGALTMFDDEYAKTASQYISWGRDCHCLPGQDNSCGKRFDFQWEHLPEGFDHKYTFTKLGYNLKMTEFQGALGYSQIKRLKDIVRVRVDNYVTLYHTLKIFKKYISYSEKFPHDFEWSASPFGFPVRLRKDYSTLINPLIQHLEKNGISTRRMFGGNLLRQPAFQNLPYIAAPDLDGANTMLERTFWIGCHPNIDDDDIKYIYDKFKEFFNERGLF